MTLETPLNKDSILEETTEIQDAGYNIPRANFIIYGIITVICILYFIFQIKP
ncbi:hypothetical protein ACFL6U_32975 [Planctomycetota bacterium]